VRLGRRQSLKPVAAQKALNLSLPVEHCNPALAADDRQTKPLRHVGARHHVLAAMAAARTEKSDSEI
jgi:hypothetical protein